MNQHGGGKKRERGKKEKKLPRLVTRPVYWVEKETLFPPPTLYIDPARVSTRASSKCQIPVLLIVPGPAVVEERLRRFGSVLRLGIPLRWALLGIRFVVSRTVARPAVSRVINYRQPSPDRSRNLETIDKTLEPPFFPSGENCITDLTFSRRA